MKNEPEEWEFQTWMVPHPIRLDRKGKEWELVFFCGSVPIEAEWGEKLAERVITEQLRIERRFRRSFRFRWIRFWYLRRHKAINN